MSKAHLTTCLALCVACGSGGSGNGSDAGVPDANPNACTTTVDATGDSQTKVQAALIAAKPGNVVCFAAGTYMFTDELSLSVSGVTLRGQPDRGQVIFDFSMQKVGGIGLLVTGGDFVLQDLTVRDTPGTSAVRVNDATNVSFRNLHVFWSRGSDAKNGAYALYPVHCTNVLVENCEINGAADAGIYVGQSANIMVRGNTVSGNVNGIEIENSTGAEVTGNTATGNAGGILVFNLPNLPVKTGRNALVHDNIIMMNNHENFASSSGVASFVPPGSGMVLLAADGTEIRNNMIMGNESTGIVMAACSTLATLSNGAVVCDDPGYDGFDEGTYIHDNVFSGNGNDPQGFFTFFHPDPQQPFQDMAWDGVTDSGKPASDDLRLCIQNNGAATFVKVDPGHPGQNLMTDLGPYNCAHPLLGGVTVTWR